MLTNLSFVPTANKIRTKLLLFIDQEIQSKIKQKKLFFNPQNEKQYTILYSNINRLYSYQENTFFISFSKFKEKISRNDTKLKKIHPDSQLSISKSLPSPITENILLKNGDLKNISFCIGNQIVKINSHNYFLSNNIINLKKNFYSDKKVLKPSNTIQIYNKKNTDKNYLKNLCHTLKLINKKDLFFNNKIKYKLSCAINNDIRKKSPTIKKAKKNQSCKSINSLCL